MKTAYGCAALAWVFVAFVSPAQEPVGERPYEMVWAGRTEPCHPPLVDFEDLEGWTVDAIDAEAAIARTREQQLWGKHVARLTYRGTSRKAELTIRPPAPIPLPPSFDCVNFWVYGNNWAWAPDRSTPQVGIHLLLETREGTPQSIRLGEVRWKEWWVMHRKLQPDQMAGIGKGASLTGIRVTNCHNEEDRVLYFDDLAFYREVLEPLTFAPRPRRGIDLFPGQDPGVYTGEDRLPFPTREETILPGNLTSEFATTLTKQGDAFVFRYRGADGDLEYLYRPAKGTLDDITARWGGSQGREFQPMTGGGVRFAAEEDAAAPERFDLLECGRVGDTVVARWRARSGSREMEATYTFRLWQKSLVLDVACPGGQVGRVQFGAATGVENPRLVTVPYLVGEEQGSHKARPAVLVMGGAGKPLFATALADYYRSNASKLFFLNETRKDATVINGGTEYIPRTDGRRNGCFERLFLTVSPRFEEVLPNIPNPKSPWMRVAGERLWRAHGAGDREQDYALWAKVARHGMTKVAITDHETGWRDGGESFTFRTRTAPGKGGDESQAEYSRKLHALGFLYGIYNNYTDFAPVNEHWDEDMVIRAPDGDWQQAWPRCYAPKPARAVEFEARLSPVIQRKFQLTTAYCDVHTAVTPWRMVDYDARVPGAGTMISQFYPYGEIMLHQKQVWNGPVYSEGRNHYYYSGLTDGNYAQDPGYDPAVNPWLVDFDLRKMHPLGCNFGMGNLEMFFGRGEGLGSVPEEQERRLDRFLAATIAFGHTGFLVREGGWRNTIRSYFLLQQIQKQYAEETATDIRYADSQGVLLDTSAAVATDAFRRSQVFTRYSNGLEVWVNGNPSEPWRIPGAELPPNGFRAAGADGRLIVFSALRNGRRADWCESPAYTYGDGRGVFTRFPTAASDEAMIALKQDDGRVEVIPIGEPESFGVALAGRAATALALDEGGGRLGPAETRLSRGLVYVTPKKGAFSYLLTPAEVPKTALECQRAEVVPNEMVTVTGREAHPFRVPGDARPGQRLWIQFEGAWIDFTVRPAVEASVALDESLRLTLTSNLPARSKGTAVLDGHAQAIEPAPGEPTTLSFPFAPPRDEGVKEIQLRVDLHSTYEFSKSWWLKAERAVQRLAGLPDSFEPGQRLRTGPETGIVSANRAQVAARADMNCGDRSRDGVFMHPPYDGGVGYSFALFDPVEIPAEPEAVFRCLVGKADGSDPGDGILFRVAVVEPGGRETSIAEKSVIDHAWVPMSGDLSAWAGKTIRIKLIADVGPADNSSGDWACWAEFAIESKAPILTATLHDDPVRLAHEPGPQPLPGLTTGPLRKATRGWLHYQAQGLSCHDPYISTAELNGIPAGVLPGGEESSETENIWSKEMRVPLPPEVLRSLGARNALKILNPGRDSFKIRHFRIELELADGRRCSSRLATAAFTQPPDWPYAEGVLVPFSQSIESAIVFDVENEDAPRP